MKNANIQIFPPGTSAVQAPSAGSNKVDTQSAVFVSAVAIVTGGTSIVGTAQFQGSNDICSNQQMAQDFTPTNWVLVGSSIPITGNGPFLIPKQDVCYRWMRVLYTWTSGTGGIVTCNFFSINQG